MSWFFASSVPARRPLTPHGTSHPKGLSRIVVYHPCQHLIVTIPGQTQDSLPVGTLSADSSFTQVYTQVHPHMTLALQAVAQPLCPPKAILKATSAVSQILYPSQLGTTGVLTSKSQTPPGAPSSPDMSLLDQTSRLSHPWRPSDPRSGPPQLQRQMLKNHEPWPFILTMWFWV